MSPKIDIKNSNYVVNEDASIQEAMEAITANHRGAAVVVDSEYHLAGITTDGTIRRAMVKGAVMQTPIRKAMNYNAVTVNVKDKDYAKKAEEILSEHHEFNLVPAIDEDNFLVDIIIRGGGYG